jgi:hypothetical protein
LNVFRRFDRLPPIARPFERHFESPLTGALCALFRADWLSGRSTDLFTIDKGSDMPKGMIEIGVAVNQEKREIVDRPFPS